MRTWSHRVIPACVAALAACGHSEPFEFGHDLNRPLVAGEPVQLTYGGGTDQGGHRYLVDTATGEERSPSDDTRWYRHPALSPTGSSLAAEGFSVSIWAFGSP